MRYALSIVGLLALYWCLINLAAVWRAHIEQRRRAMKRHPAKRIVTEECPVCYGMGCDFCENTGSVTHGPWANCSFCGVERCCGSCCQCYCPCTGYWNYYIKPYEEENRRNPI